MLQNLTAYRRGIIILFTVEPTRLYMELSGAGNSGNKIVNITLNPELPKILSICLQHPVNTEPNKASLSEKSCRCRFEDDSSRTYDFVHLSQTTIDANFLKLPLR